MTRGQRNNNPLNIRHSTDRWQGARIQQTDPSFVQFESMAYGYRAAWRTLESYWKHFHRTNQYFNVTNIIGRWAPPTENDTQSYIRTVLKLSGLGGRENLPQPSRGVNTEKLVNLIAAMTTVECGTPYAEVDTEAIRQGFALAFPDKRSYARTQPATENRPTEEDLLMLDEYWQW